MEEQFAFIGSHCGESVTIETPKCRRLSLPLAAP
jgi:hypothetical protein